MSHKVVVNATTGETDQVPLSQEEVSELEALQVAADANLLSDVIALIKAEAARRILVICPDWKQRNLTARAAELAIKGAVNWTEAELAEIAAGQSIWDSIKAVRNRSNLLELAVSGMTLDELKQFNALSDTHWG